MRHTRQPFSFFLLAASVLAATFFSTRAHAEPVAGVSVLFSWKTLTPGGTLSSYTYNEATDTYYVATFGTSAGLHSVSRNTPGDPYTPDVYVETGTSAFPSDLYRFYRATDVPGGDLNVDFYGNPLLSGILLNPAPVTVSVPMPDGSGNPTATMMDVTYQPGELAFITDGGTDIRDGGSSGTRRFDLTKKLYRWDLREIGTPTSDQPDYSTGKSGAPAPNENPGGLFGALGQADWNDVFTVAATEEDLRNAYTAFTGNAPNATSSDNFGRQPVWSTDGQHLYAVDSGTTGGGIYKVNAGTGAVEQIYSEDGGSNIIAEPAVVHTSTRDFGSGFGAGDQVLFDGNNNNGNSGGLSYVVDTGSGVSGMQVAYTGAEFAAYTGIAAQDLDSLTADSDGNVYVFDGATDSFHVWDTDGRFRSVLNRAQLFELNHTNDGRRHNSGALLRLDIRESGGETVLTYRGDNDYVAAVKVFEGGDVNRDGTVDQADRDFFIEQINKTFHHGAPNPHEAAIDDNDTGGQGAALVASYLDYINADLNGDTDPRNGDNPTSSSATTKGMLPGLDGGGVDYLDLDVLTQFTNLELGDFNWDGTALDTADWDIFNTHYLMDPADFGYDAFSWFDGDVTGLDANGMFNGTPDGLVNLYDLQFLQGASLLVVPEPSTLTLVFVALVGFGSRRRRRRSTRC